MKHHLERASSQTWLVETGMYWGGMTPDPTTDLTTGPPGATHSR